MAYRRRQGIQRATTFKEETNWRRADGDGDGNGDSLSFRSDKSSSSSSSLAAQAIRASAAHRDSSLSSAYANSAFHSSFKDRSKDSPAFGQTSPVSPTEAGGFWGVVARKAKAILENGNLPNNLDTNNTVLSSSIDGEFYTTYQPAESSRKLDNPRLRKGLDALATSLNQIGDTIGTALEEGRTIVESRTADIIQETRKLQNRRREETNQASGIWHQKASHVHMQASQEDQLKASRDVAMATAAKAKLLLRELVTLNISANLQSLFTWNTKQVFVFLAAEYETPKNALNQASLWDGIIPSKEHAKFWIHTTNKYRFIDQGSNLRGRDFNLTLHWHVMPKTGKMSANKIVMSGYHLPESYR